MCVWSMLNLPVSEQDLEIGQYLSNEKLGYGERPPLHCTRKRRNIRRFRNSAPESSGLTNGVNQSRFAFCTADCLATAILIRG